MPLFCRAGIVDKKREGATVRDGAATQIYRMLPELFADAQNA
jgi:hypothetical protein